MCRRLGARVVSSHIVGPDASLSFPCFSQTSDRFGTISCIYLAYGIVPSSSRIRTGVGVVWPSFFGQVRYGISAGLIGRSAQEQHFDRQRQHASIRCCLSIELYQVIVAPGGLLYSRSCWQKQVQWGCPRHPDDRCRRSCRPIAKEAGLAAAKPVISSILEPTCCKIAMVQDDCCRILLAEA